MSYLRIFSSQSEYDSANMPNGSVGLIKENEDDRGSVVWWKDSLYQWVDLGLPSGLKWSAWNVGATKPEEFGLYFAWGETQGYVGITDDKKFSSSDYKFTVDNGSTFTKYNGEDELLTLETTDDAAYKTDITCRIPTKAEITELFNNTTKSSNTINGIKGIILTSKTNGNSIFIPGAGACAGGSVNYAGYVYLWTNTKYSYSHNLAVAYQEEDTLSIDTLGRWCGLSIRPVKL